MKQKSVRVSLILTFRDRSREIGYSGGRNNFGVVSCSGGWAPVCRGICSGGCDFRAKVGLLFGGVILPTMHLDCNLLIQACGSRRLGVVAACLVFVGDVASSILPLGHASVPTPA